MSQFRQHYSRDEARQLLPQLRLWLDRLSELHDQLGRAERRLESLRERGRDLGGQSVNSWMRTTLEMSQILSEFHSREIQLKDLERGLVDFPAMVGGREVFLCWEKCEDDIGFWHELDTGYAGREPL